MPGYGQAFQWQKMVLPCGNQSPCFLHRPRIEKQAIRMKDSRPRKDRHPPSTIQSQTYRRVEAPELQFSYPTKRRSPNGVLSDHWPGRDQLLSADGWRQSTRSIKSLEETPSPSLSVNNRHQALNQEPEEVLTYTDRLCFFRESSRSAGMHTRRKSIPSN